MRYNKFILVFLLFFSISFKSQEKKVLECIENDENVVASAIEGTWISEQEPMIFKKDTTVLSILSQNDTSYNFLKSHQIYHAGYIDNLKQHCIYVLIVYNGNPHIVVFRKDDSTPLGSFNLFIAKGEQKQSDRLFVGGDFNNQAFYEYKRAKETKENKKPKSLTLSKNEK